MTTSLLITRESQRAVVLADPAEVSAEPVLAGLASLLASERVIYPLSDRFPQRAMPPPSLMRARHADLWHGLSEERRSRVRLVAGPTAAFFAPVMPPDTEVLVVMPGPTERRGGARELWRSVLGGFPELDEAPDEPESDAERERWLTRIRDAMSGLAFVRISGLNDLAMELCASLGLSPKRSARLANVAEAAGADGGATRQKDAPIHWIDELLYGLSRPPRMPPKRPRN